VLHLTLTELYRRAGPELFARLSLGHVARQVNLEQEGNLTAWYSSATLLFCALLLGARWQRARAGAERFAANWGLLCAAFVYLSADESASLHEAAMEIIWKRVHVTGIFHYAWVILALPLVVLFGIYNLRFLRSLPTRIRNGFIVAGAVFVGGALGLEMVEGQIASTLGDTSTVMQVARTLEEVLEMSGIIIFIDTLLLELSSAPATALERGLAPGAVAPVRH
jgi:hypothetical protein